MKRVEYVKINKALLEQIYNISKNLTREVEDWSFGDFYPERVTEKVFSDTLIDEMRKALNRKI